MRPLVDVIKLFLEEFWKIEISPQAETARIGHLIATNSFRVLLCLKIAKFSHFCSGLDSITIFFHILILGKSRFPPRKVL